MEAGEYSHYNQCITKHNATYFSHLTDILFTSDSGLWSITVIIRNMNSGFPRTTVMMWAWFYFG